MRLQRCTAASAGPSDHGQTKESGLTSYLARLLTTRLCTVSASRFASAKLDRLYAGIGVDERDYAASRSRKRMSRRRTALFREGIQRRSGVIASRERRVTGGSAEGGRSSRFGHCRDLLHPQGGRRRNGRAADSDSHARRRLTALRYSWNCPILFDNDVGLLPCCIQ